MAPISQSIRSIKAILHTFVLICCIMLSISCKETVNEPKTATQEPIPKKVTAQDILGNPDYLAISYGGYRMQSRDCLLYTSPSPRDLSTSRMPSSA